MKGPTFSAGASVPKHVELPPEVLEALPWMSKAELKVIIVALAYPDVPLTFTLFQEKCGLSRQSVRSGIADAMERGLLERTPVTTDRGQATYGYSIRSAIVVASKQSDATKRGLKTRLLCRVKNRPIEEYILGLKQFYSNRGQRSLKIRLLSGDAAGVSCRALEDALKAAGVFRSVRGRMLEKAVRDDDFATRIVMALYLYPLAQELGLAEGSGWLVRAIENAGEAWDLPTLAEDYMERFQARAAQRAARESLPADILQMLEKIGWASGFREIATAFRDDPRRVRGLLLEAVEADDQEHAAAHFRNALRSGAQPDATTLYRITTTTA